MRYLLKLLPFTLILILLGACAPKEDAADLYKQEFPLEADVTLPDPYTSKEPIKIVLTQDGEKVENANFVHVEVWKADGSFRQGMEEAENEGKGLYTFKTDLKEEGLYYVKVHAGSNGSTIMPTKPLAVGELSKADIEALNGNAPQQSGGSGHHH